MQAVRVKEPTSSARRRTCATARPSRPRSSARSRSTTTPRRSGIKRYPLGREPITLRDGTPLTDAKGRRSYVTSAGAGPSIGKYILLAYLPPEHAVEGSQELAVEYMTERYPVTVDVVGPRPDLRSREPEDPVLT